MQINICIFRYNFYTLAMLLVFSSCNKPQEISSFGVDRDSQASSTVASGREPTLFETKFFQLPINTRVKRFGVGAGIEPIPISLEVPAELGNLLQASGISLINENKYANSHPVGSFVLDSSNRVIGFSFIRSNQLGLIYYEEYEGKTSDIGDSLPRMFALQGDHKSREKARSESIIIQSLAGLKEIDTIEFIDFDLAMFASGIWQDISKMCSSGQLKGISVFNGDDLISTRTDEVVSEMKGLVVHLNDISKLMDYGLAFPNLTFLVLNVDERLKINEVIEGGLLRTSFPNLKGVMLANSYWPSELDSRNEQLGCTKRLRMASLRVPDNIKWICLSGGLMSKDDMREYDVFARRLRYGKERYEFDKTPTKDVDVLFYGFGFATGGGARSMGARDYFEAERFWRAK